MERNAVWLKKREERYAGPCKCRRGGEKGERALGQTQWKLDAYAMAWLQKSNASVFPFRIRSIVQSEILNGMRKTTRGRRAFMVLTPGNGQYFLLEGDVFGVETIPRILEERTKYDYLL